MLNKPRSHDQPPPKKTPTEILVRVFTGFILQEGKTETSLPSFCTPPNWDRKAGVTGLAFALTAGLPSFLPLLFSCSLRGSEDRYEHAKSTGRRKPPCGFCVIFAFSLCSSLCPQGVSKLADCQNGRQIKFWFHSRQIGLFQRF